MDRKYIKSLILRISFVLLSTQLSSSFAWEESPLEWHLYGTLGFSHTDNIKSIEQKNVPYSYVEPGASLKPLSKLALQGSYNFSEKLDFTVQAVTRGYEDFEPEVEWVYLKYALLNDLNLRVGRIRRPLFMHSDSYNVAYAYPWSRPPGVTYFEFTGLYQSIDAIDISYNGWLGSWGFSTEAYFGEGRSDTGYIKDILTTYSSDESYGAVFSLEKGEFNVRLGYHEADFSVDIPISQTASTGFTQLGFSNLAETLAIEHKQATFSSLGGGYRYQNFEFNAELTHLGSDDSILAAITSGYLGISWIRQAYTFNYTFGRHRSKSNSDFVTPIYQAAQAVAASNTPESAVVADYLNTIAAGLTDYTNSNENRRTSHRLGLRYDLLSNSALKAEVEWIEDEDSSDKATVLNLSVDFVY